jgi:hypothetical protein
MYPIHHFREFMKEFKVETKEVSPSFSLLIGRHSSENKEEALETFYKKQCSPLILYIKSIRKPKGTEFSVLEDLPLIVSDPKAVWEYNIEGLKKMYQGLSDSDLFNLSPPEELLCEHMEAQIQVIFDRLEKGPLVVTLQEKRAPLALKSAFLALVIALQEKNRKDPESDSIIKLTKSFITGVEASFLFELLNELKVFYLDLDLSDNLIDDEAKSSIQSYMNQEECLATINLKNNKLKERIETQGFCTLIN